MSEQRTSDILKDQLDRVLRSYVDMPLLHAAEGGTRPDALENALAGLGFETALVPEDRGGAGLAWSDLGGIFETLGYHAAPVPLGETILAHWALAQLEHPLPEGVVPLISLDQLPLGSNGRANGIVQIPWGRQPTHVLAELHGKGVTRLGLIDASSAQVSALRTVGRDPSARLAFYGAEILASAPIGVIGLIPALAVLRAAQISGALSRALELCIDYGNTRVQFGRPINKFQAVQHLIAGLAGEAACAKTGVQLALSGFDAGAGWESAAIAKIRASGAVAKSTFAAHEAHGAIGVTEEHILHYFTRRLWQWRDEAGNEHYWSERLGHSIMADRSAPLWERIVAWSND